MNHLMYTALVGLIQGLTEFLPVSSSGHLILLPYFLHQPDQGLVVDMAANLGTLAALLLYFWRDVLGLFKGLTQHKQRATWHLPEAKMLRFLVVGALPGLLVGFVLMLFDATDSLRQPLLIAATMAGFGLLLGFADYKGAKNIPLTSLNWRHVLVVGFAQILAFLPGTSRSGVTMTVGLLMGLERAAAARFSFLLSIPTVGAACAAVLAKFALNPPSVVPWAVLGVATATAFVAGLLAIHVLLRWVSHHSFMPFVVYRLALAAVIVVVLV